MTQLITCFLLTAELNSSSCKRTLRKGLSPTLKCFDSLHPFSNKIQSVGQLIIFFEAGVGRGPYEVRCQSRSCILSVLPLHGHPKTQTMQTAERADCADCTLFLTLDSLFSLPVKKYVLMFVIFPQATETQHLTVDSRV